MTISTVSALTCPACGGPLTNHAANRCRFCGVALVLPVSIDERFTVSEPAAIHHEITRLREQLRLDPTRSGTHRRLGHVYQTLGLTDDAVRALTVAVGLAPEEITPRLELATLLASQSAAGLPDAFPAAMRHVRQVLSLEPESSDGHLLLARLLTQRGRYGEARTTLGGITALPPEEIHRRTAWVTLAEAADHERRGDRRGAVAAWRRIAGEAPDLVRPAVASFLTRTAVMSRPKRTHRSIAPRILRAVLVAMVAVLGGMLLGLPWPVLIAVVGVAALLTVSGRRIGLGRGAIEAPGLLRRGPASGNGGSLTGFRLKRPLAPICRRMSGRSGSAQPDADLTRLLREAEAVAARADVAGRQRQLDWADNLAVALPRR